MRCRLGGLLALLARCMLALASIAATASTARAAPAAEARPLNEVLHLHAGASCLDRAQLVTQVALWLDSDSTDADVTIDVVGNDDDARLVAFRVMQGDDVLAHRTFAPGPAVCEHLHATLGLAIALALKAQLIEELSVPFRDDPSRRSRAWSAGAAVVPAWDIVPGLSAGFDLRVERALPPNFALRFGVFGLGGFDKTFARSTGRFDTALVALRADACVNITLLHALDARSCAGFFGGGVYAQGRAFVTSKQSMIAWFALEDSLELVWQLSSHWSLDFGVFLVMPLRRTAIVVKNGAGVVVDTRDLTALGGGLSLGPLYRF